MVLEALKKPMPTMAPIGTAIGGCDASASVARMEMITRLPLTAIHLRVSRRRSSGPKASIAELIGDDGGKQDIAGLDRAQTMHLAQERTAPQALHG